jgi:hypothetical protein
MNLSTHKEDIAIIILYALNKNFIIPESQMGRNRKIYKTTWWHRIDRTVEGASFSVEELTKTIFPT